MVTKKDGDTYVQVHSAERNEKETAIRRRKFKQFVRGLHVLRRRWRRETRKAEEARRLKEGKARKVSNARSAGDAKSADSAKRKRRLRSRATFWWAAWRC